MKLYHHPLSGHAHRARLFLHLLGIEHDAAEVDLAAREHKSADYLRLNRFGQIPVLVDGEHVIADSNAILVYLAKKARATQWLPDTPVEAAAVQRWLSVAAGQIAFGPAAARLVTVFGAPFNAEEVIARAHAVLEVLDDELQNRDWIADIDAAHPTIADIALYSYISSAPEGNVDLSDYPAVNAWLRRVEALPRFLAFQKTRIGLAA
jgi:glutathione S-transferase